MRVLWISHTARLDGAERCLIEAVKGLAEKDVINDVILPEEGALIGEISDFVRTVIIQPNPWWTMQYGKASILRRVVSYIRHSRKIGEAAKNLNSDLIVSNSLVIPCGAFAAKLIGIPHIWYIHEFLKEDHQMDFVLGRKLSLQFVNKLSRQIITTSQTVLERFKGEIPANKMHAVYCASEIPHKTTRNSTFDLLQGSGKFNLVLIGRKSPSKGQKDAIEALARLDEKLNIRLWLIGGDLSGYEDELKSLARALGVLSKIEFVAFTENPLAYLIKADAVLMTSRNEAFGRTIAEAMKLGKAIIASDGGASKELIIENQTGLLYRSGDAASLAEKIEILYRDDALRRKLEIDAKEWSLPKFNLEQYASSLITIFEKTLN